MKNNDFKINFTVIGVLLITSIMLMITMFFPFFGEMRFIFGSFGTGIFFVSWLIVFIDILKHKVYNRQFWIISMFALMTIAPIVYLIRRNKIILE